MLSWEIFMIKKLLKCLKELFVEPPLDTRPTIPITELGYYKTRNNHVVNVHIRKHNGEYVGIVETAYDYERREYEPDGKVITDTYKEHPNLFGHPLDIVERLDENKQSVEEPDPLLTGYNLGNVAYYACTVTSVILFWMVLSWLIYFGVNTK